MYRKTRNTEQIKEDIKAYEQQIYHAQELILVGGKESFYKGEIIATKEQNIQRAKEIIIHAKNEIEVLELDLSAAK